MVLQKGSRQIFRSMHLPTRRGLSRWENNISALSMNPYSFFATVDVDVTLSPAKEA